MTALELIDALEIELTTRGIEYSKPDVFSFVAAAWDEHDTGKKSVSEWADSFIEGLEA